MFARSFRTAQAACAHTDCTAWLLHAPSQVLSAAPYVPCRAHVIDWPACNNTHTPAQSAARRATRPRRRPCPQSSLVMRPPCAARHRRPPSRPMRAAAAARPACVHACTPVMIMSAERCMRDCAGAAHAHAVPRGMRARRPPMRLATDRLAPCARGPSAVRPEGGPPGRMEPTASGAIEGIEGVRRGDTGVRARTAARPAQSAAARGTQRAVLRRPVAMRGRGLQPAG